MRFTPLGWDELRCSDDAEESRRLFRLMGYWGIVSGGMIAEHATFRATSRISPHISAGCVQRPLIPRIIAALSSFLVPDVQDAFIRTHLHSMMSLI